MQRSLCAYCMAACERALVCVCVCVSVSITDIHTKLPFLFLLIKLIIYHCLRFALYMRTCVCVCACALFFPFLRSMEAIAQFSHAYTFDFQ